MSNSLPDRPNARNGKYSGIGIGIPFRFGCLVVQAAEAVGVSVNTYVSMVEDGRMPQPKRIGSRKVWDVEEVYAAFKALPHEKQIDEGEPDTWSDLGG